ncbi:TIGR02710 family CRISPR-associated CARF protein [Methylohalobius crimeensis]|uniref:TIGR02710 family CRISPR-associated CARF protein n=1 Tax=Methylohalobius crimeensis TaxID=244365 RepID=UPI0003B6FF0F|nr:TIGR02710 family CRISPR-associated CARF protein [Methylohalobius crimeensis]
MPPTTTTLICTVGGSHQPIVRAVNELQPDYVCFVCSEDDPATGNKGSYVQITGKGNIIKARREDDKPSLPNIPAQTGLAEDQFEALRVQADDFDDVYRQVSHWLTTHNHDQERIVADYTGGTKTMTAALVAAALDDEGVELQLVTGSRANLISVESGSEQAIPASVEATRFRRRLREATEAWSRFAYDETEAMLARIRPPRESGLRGEYQRARDLSRAFTAWDRFDHAAAKRIVDRYRRLLGPTLGPLLNHLDLLNRDVPAREPLRLFDLWRNAQRRADQGRHDDAVARLYRLAEWSAQWLLREQADIHTADVPKDKIPSDITLSFNHRTGQYQAGLFNAWDLAAHHIGGGLPEWWERNRETLLNQLMARNQSILAHGFEPLDEGAWRRFSQWIEQELIENLLLKFTGDDRYRLKRLPEQLPRCYPFGG